MVANGIAWPGVLRISVLDGSITDKRESDAETILDRLAVCRRLEAHSQDIRHAPLTRSYKAD